MTERTRLLDFKRVAKFLLHWRTAFHYERLTLSPLPKSPTNSTHDVNYRIPGIADVKRLQFDRANLQYLKNRAVAIKASEPYQGILDKWLKGDLSNFENDYLTIRSLKGAVSPSESPVLKVRTAEEEQKYIEHFFGNEGLQINKMDWQ